MKAVLKYGKKPFALDENRRDTYRHPLASMHEPSVTTAFGGELKQLMVVCKKKFLIICFGFPIREADILYIGL